MSVTSQKATAWTQLRRVQRGHPKLERKSVKTRMGGSESWRGKGREGEGRGGGGQRGTGRERKEGEREGKGEGPEVSVCFCVCVCVCVGGVDGCANVEGREREEARGEGGVKGKEGKGEGGVSGGFDANLCVLSRLTLQLHQIGSSVCALYLKNSAP